MSNNDEAENCYQSGYEAGDRTWQWQTSVDDNIKDVNEAVEAAICTKNGNAESYGQGYKQAYEDTNSFASLKK